MFLHNSVPLAAVCKKRSTLPEELESMIKKAAWDATPSAKAFKQAFLEDQTCGPDDLWYCKRMVNHQCGTQEWGIGRNSGLIYSTQIWKSGRTTHWIKNGIHRQIKDRPRAQVKVRNLHLKYVDTDRDTRDRQDPWIYQEILRRLT